MDKYLIRLTDKERAFIEQMVYSTAKHYSSRQKQKAKVILLRADKKDIATIIKQTGLSKRSIINYTKDYLSSSKNITFFYKHKYKVNKSALFEYKDIILDSFKEDKLTTYKEATLRIEKLTGIKRSETQVRKFLKGLKFFSDRTLDNPSIIRKRKTLSPYSN